MELSTPLTVALAAAYTEAYGADTACPERTLWLATLRQAAADLRDPNPKIKRDAVEFFESDDLLQVLDYAGISRANAPWLRAKAEELAEVPAEQRQPNVRLITYQGQTHSLTEWAKLTGISIFTLGHRLRNGWSIKRALETPGRRRAATATVAEIHRAKERRRQG